MPENRRHTRTRRTATSPMNELDKSEASFQGKLLHAASCNGWRVDVGHLSKHTRHPEFCAQLEQAAPNKRLRTILEWLWDRKDYVFTFGYHTHDSRKSQRGFPDVTLVHPTRGVVLFAELKKAGRYPTMEQRLWLAALRMVEKRAPDVVKVFLWDPRDWPEIVEVLGGIDPYGTPTPTT